MKTYTLSFAVAALFGYVQSKTQCQMYSNGADISYQCLDDVVKSETDLPSQPTTLSAEKTIHEGTWGNWSPWFWATSEELGCGVDLKVEAKRGGGDDASTNAIDILYCNVNDWNSQRWSGYHGGWWGNWETKKCPEGMYISSLQQEFEDPCGACDDTAGNRVRFRCRNLFGTRMSSMYTLGSRDWGDWKSSQWNDNQYPGQWLCGVKARIEPKQGGGDDSGLNGIQVGLCEVPRTFNVQLEPQAGVKCTMSGSPQNYVSTKNKSTTCNSSAGCHNVITMKNSYSETSKMTKSTTIMRESTESWANSKTLEASIGFSVSFSQGNAAFASATQTISGSLTASTTAERSGSTTHGHTTATSKEFSKTVSLEDSQQVTLTVPFGQCEKATLETTLTKMQASCTSEYWFSVKTQNGWLKGDDLVQAFRSAGYHDNYAVGSIGQKQYLKFYIQSAHNFSVKTDSQMHQGPC